MTSYISLLSKIEAFCNAHLQIKKYGGEFREQMPNFATKDEKYPVVFVTPTSDTEALNTNQFTVDIYCVDLIQADRTNLNSIISDCQLILKDMYVYYTNDNDVEIDVVGTASMTPLNNQDLDYVAGWVMSITFEVASYGDCAIPMNPINPNPPIVCEDATQIINDSNGNQLYSNSIPSGATETQVIADSTVTITDDSLNTLYTLSVNAEGSASQVIQDSTAVLKNTDNTILSTTSINAEASADIVAPDGHVHIKKENDGTIANVFVPSGTTETYDVADNDISVNGILEFDIHATDSLDIRLRDTSNAVITPNSVTESGNHAVIVIPDTTLEVNGTIEGTVVSGSTVDIQLSDSGGVVTPTSVTQVGTDFQVVLPDAAATPRSTATLMKTGQTTSYRTGDDGDLEAGRDTDFLTLDAAPLHNDGSATINTTTNRFTDTLGGSTYADDIVLDWSTWNGSTLLGYYRVINDSNVNWDTAIDNCLAVTVGAFTTGWRLPNRKEMFNIMLHEGATLNRPLNYAPFNISPSTVFYTSTTNAATTTRCYSLSNDNSAALALTTKTVTGRYFPCRTFSLSLLNVLS
jgi:hypothetical protein